MDENVNFELPNHEILRMIGNVTVQLGLTMIGISTIIKQLGNLPDYPVGPPGLGSIMNEKHNDNKKGYFD